MKFNLDPNLEEYATEKQWSYLKAIAEHGSERAAARELGITASLVGRAKHAVLRKATNRGYSPDHNFRHTVPDGQKLRGVSTHYNKDGEVTAQWVKSQEDRERQAEILEEMAEGFAADLPQAHPVLQPSTEGAPELMACYPVGDHHMGMLAWDKETGGDYDLGLSEQLLMGAMNWPRTARRPPSCCLGTSCTTTASYQRRRVGRISLTPTVGSRVWSSSLSDRSAT